MIRRRLVTPTPYVLIAILIASGKGRIRQSIIARPSIERGFMVHCALTVTKVSCRAGLPPTLSVRLSCKTLSETPLLKLRVALLASWPKPWTMKTASG
jgi:hypothetical protein